MDSPLWTRGDVVRFRWEYYNNIVIIIPKPAFYASYAYTYIYLHIYMFLSPLVIVMLYHLIYIYFFLNLLLLRWDNITMTCRQRNTYCMIKHMKHIKQVSGLLLQYYYNIPNLLQHVSSSLGRVHVDKSFIDVSYYSNTSSFSSTNCQNLSPRMTWTAASEPGYFICLHKSLCFHICLLQKKNLKCKRLN